MNLSEIDIEVKSIINNLNISNSRSRVYQKLKQLLYNNGNPDPGMENITLEQANNILK